MKPRAINGNKNQILDPEWAKKKLAEMDAPAPPPKPAREPLIVFCPRCQQQLVWRRVGHHLGLVCPDWQCMLKARRRIKAECKEKIYNAKYDGRVILPQRNTALDRGAQRIAFNKLPTALQARIAKQRFGDERGTP